MSSLFSRTALKTVKPAQAEFAKFFMASAINYRMMNIGEVHDRYSIFVYASCRKREQSNLHRSIRSYYKNGSGNGGEPGDGRHTCDDMVPRWMYDDLLTRIRNLARTLGEKESQLRVLRNAYLPLYSVVTARQRIENKESLFGIHYPYNHRKPDKKSQVVAVYNFHFEKWIWIWEECKDRRWLAMKKEIMKEGIEKEDACGSIASILSLARNNIHFPESLGEVDDEEVFRCLNTKMGIDMTSINCLRPLYNVKI